YPEAAAWLHVDDVLVDSMRGRSTNWVRIRINLRNIPEGERPPEGPPEPDYDPWPAAPRGCLRSRAPKTRSRSHARRASTQSWREPRGAFLVRPHAPSAAPSSP